MGLDLVQVLSSLGTGVTTRTLNNWAQGKTVPRASTFSRFIGTITSDYSIEEGEKAVGARLYECAIESTESNLFFLQWEQFLQGYEFNNPPEPSFFIEEIKKFVELTRSIKAFVESRDAKGLGDALQDSFIPKTNLTLDAIRDLQTANTYSDTLLRNTIFPIILSNTLYLIACWDTEQELLTRICPLFDGGKVTLPIARWLDAVRSDLSLSSDTALGEIVFPDWQPDNAGNQIKKWRAGQLPSWKTLKGLKIKRSKDQLYESFALIRILHGIHDELERGVSTNITLDSKTLFETAPQLQQIACERNSAH